MVRYYKGKYKIKMILIGKPNSLVESLETAMIGQKSTGYRMVGEGEQFTCRTRDCWRKKREVKK